MCDLLAELLVERGDLPGALAWATAGIELCLGRTPGPVAPDAQPAGPGRPREGRLARLPRPVTANGEPGGELATSAHGDETELRLLLTLRFRIRNDLGLPEDDYDRLLDAMPLRKPSPGH